MNRYEMKSTTKHIEERIIYHNDYMYPIFQAINQEYVGNWNENGCDTWNHSIGKLYQLLVMGPYTWIELEYPDGLEIDMSEDGHIENTKYGQKFHLQIPSDWNLIKINIDNKEIELRKKNQEE